MYDYSKLKGRIKEKGYIQDDVAKAINNNRSTFSLKLNNRFLFNQDEIVAIVKFLDIPAEELQDYFFTEKV